jgi:hypothetical protein
MAFTYRGEQVDLGFGRGWLDRPAAESVLRIDGQLRHPLQITEAGRYYATQQKHYDIYLRVGYPIALSPDAPSVHQKGGAIDSNEAQRIVSILEDHGWRRTVYRWVNGKWTLVEAWHFEYFAHLDNHRNDLAGDPGHPVEGFLMALTDAEQRIILEAARGLLSSEDQVAQFQNVQTIRDRVEGFLSSTNQVSLFQNVQAIRDRIEVLVQQQAPGVDIDEKALAAEIAPMLASLIEENLGSLSDDTIARVSKAVNDEQDRRHWERLRS